MTDQTITLTVGGDRLSNLFLEIDDILARLTQELAAADAAAAHDDNDDETLRPITIALSGRSWSAESMARFVPFLERIAPRVIALEADDIIAQQETRIGYQVMHMMAEALRHATNLRAVNLNDNALGPPTLKNIRVILTPRLTSIKLYNTGVDTVCMRILRRMLLGIPVEEGDDDHDNNEPADDNVVCDLEELDCSRNTIGIGGAEQVGRLLPHCPNLIVFIYAGARPNTEGSVHIARGLQLLMKNRQALAAKEETATKYEDANLQVRVLNLSEGNYGYTLNDHLEPLCDALRSMPHLETLVLNDCGISVANMELLIHALEASNARLRQLHLGDMGEMGEEGGMRLAALLERYTETMQVLFLEGNELGWKGLRALTPFFATCHTLQTVNLTRNDLGPRAAKELIKLPDSTSWATLVLEDNWLDNEDVQEQLVQHFAHTEIVFGDDQDEGDEEDEEDEEDEAGDEVEEAKDGVADELVDKLEHLNL